MTVPAIRAYYRLFGMHWFTTSDGTRFLVQDPAECARSLARAFPDGRAAVTPRRFLAQVKIECPPPALGGVEAAAGRKQSRKAG